MKRVVLLLSHLGADSKILYSVLDNHPQISGFSLKSYDSFESLEDLTSKEHKLDNSSAIFLDRLLYNHQISCSKIYSLCKFLIFIRGPESISSIMANENMNYSLALKYYSYRLRRLAEISRKTDYCLFTWEDLRDKNFSKITSFLELSSPISMTYNLKPLEGNDKKAKERYEFYLRYLNH